MLRENKPHNCLSVILLYYIINVDEKYYPYLFLRECKYAEKKKEYNECR